MDRALETVIKCNSPEYEHGIDPAGLDLITLHDGGHVVTDGCNCASKFNRKMFATIKNAKKGEFIGASITAAIADASNPNPADDGNLQKDFFAEWRNSGCSSTYLCDKEYVPLASITSESNSNNLADYMSQATVLEIYCHHHGMFGEVLL